MSALPPKLGKYHLLERIAQGGMAEVYRAKTVGIAGFEKILALKRILPRLAREPRFIRNFVDEARIAVSLNHRNIVQVFDFGKAEGELYLAMELIEGVALRSALRAATEQGLAMPPGLACYVLADVGAGLDYAHRKRDAAGRPLGIVHCDVSPHNVMLSREGFVKVLDFGVARARFTAAPQTRRLRGKPRYMAPEQTRGEVPTAAADVFALGILSWEVLTGRPLFGARDLKATIAAVRRADVPRVDALAEVPAYLADAIATALSLEPEQRGSAGELAAQLARAARDLATVAASRALAEWLDELYPRADHDPEESTAPEVPSRRLASIVPAELVPDPDTEAESGPEEALPELTDPTAETSLDAALEPGALLEKRRVVVTAVLVDGGSPPSRGQLVRILADLAYKRGAVIQEQGDDAVVAVFGLEIAGEDDVAGAMRYALDAVELARETGGDTERALSVRIATRAGLVAQRRRGGYRLRADAVAEARTLARDAEPGRPLLTGGTGRLASAHFSFRELPARRLRSRRLRVLELLGPRDYDERARALRDRSGRFVGRADELARMAAAYQRVLDGGGRVVVSVVGGAGVGKSRLVAELVAHASASATEPVRIAVGATGGNRDAPYSLVTELVQASLNLPPERGEAARARLAQRLSSLGRDLDLPPDELREAASALELAMELRDGALGAPVHAAADLRDRVAGSLRRFRDASRGRRPLLTVIENLELADRASLDVLRGAIEGGAPRRPELIVLTARAPLDDQLGALVDEHIELGELSGDDRRALIGERLGDDADDDLVTTVARRAGGNPLYIEELVAVIRDVGPDATPATVRDVILARVDRLPRAAKAVLQHAAILGPTFRTRILEELVGHAVDGPLRILSEEGLLVRRDQASIDADEGELRFRHGLIQEVVCETLAAGPRRATHARLGRILALRAGAGRDEPPAVVARHLELGGAHDEAAEFWIRAGRVALAAHEPAAAQGAFSRALELDDGADDGARRRAALLGRERAHRDLGDHEAQARDLAALEHIAADDPALEADVRNRVAHRLLRTGDFQAALRAARAAEEASRIAGDELSRGEALRLLGEAYERTGAFDRGLEAARQAIAIFQAIGAPDAEVRARIDIGRNHLVRSRYSDARAIYEPILERLFESADPWLERIVRNHLAVIHLCMGEFEDAMRSARRSVEICQYYGDRARAGDNISVCGIVLAEVGQFEEARRCFDEALDIHDETQSRWSRADCLVYAGANLASLGALEPAVAQLGEALAAARELGAPYIEANAGSALARAYLLRSAPGDLERALDAAAAATDVAAAATLDGAQVLALTRQAEALRRRGAPRAAQVSTRAVELLERQGYIEGAEEDVLLTHQRALAAVGDPAAEDVLARARASLDAKLDRLVTPAWRRSFVESIPFNAAILAATS